MSHMFSLQKSLLGLLFFKGTKALKNVILILISFSESSRKKKGMPLFFIEPKKKFSCKKQQ